MQTLLPPAEGTMGYILGGDVGRYNALFTQHLQGVTRQHAGYYQYIFTETNTNTDWSNFYPNMFNLQIIIDKSTTNGSPHYRGAARVLMALSLGNVTDLWGDVPYADALKGNNNLSPKYQSQQELYPIIQKLLDDGITDLSSATSSFKMGTDDQVFAGNLAKWIRAAYSLKARYWIHLTKVDNTAADKALAAVAKAMQANTDNMQFVFGGTATTENPWSQFNNQRGDVDIADYFYGMLGTLKDPRVVPFWDDGSLYMGSGSPVPFITYTEVKFIEAEALLRTSKTTEAKTAFTNAVTASLAASGISASASTTYLAQTAVTPTGDITMDRILQQKYIALFTQSESWTDWRRTGMPSIPATAGFKTTDIPRRWPYPLNERLNNVNYPGLKNNTDRVWWDKQ